ncbi:helix-turn-helix transcriptional regulator [Celeribacter sp. ULVN23_4]
MIRQKLGMTQKDVALKMNTTQQTVARWESGKTPLNVDQVRDLCLALGCSAEELLGFEVEPEEIRKSPFAIGKQGTPYGTLKIDFLSGSSLCPIDEDALSSLKNQLGRDRFAFDRNGGHWMQTWTLDNRTLLINPTKVKHLEWYSDAVEEMPDFENPEVYRALEQMESDPPSGEMLEVCKRIVDERGQEWVWALTNDVVVVFDDGEKLSGFLDADIAAELFDLTCEAPKTNVSVFVMLEEEGHDRSQLVNLQNVAMVQFPSDRFHRLIRSE